MLKPHLIGSAAFAIAQHAGLVGKMIATVNRGRVESPESATIAAWTLRKPSAKPGEDFASDVVLIMYAEGFVTRDCNGWRGLAIAGIVSKKEEELALEYLQEVQEEIERATGGKMQNVPL